jgi:hypothetical protein
VVEAGPTDAQQRVLPKKWHPHLQAHLLHIIQKWIIHQSRPRSRPSCPPRSRRSVLRVEDGVLFLELLLVEEVELLVLGWVVIQPPEAVLHLQRWEGDLLDLAGRDIVQLLDLRLKVHRQIVFLLALPERVGNQQLLLLGDSSLRHPSCVFWRNRVQGCPGGGSS